MTVTEQAAARASRRRLGPDLPVRFLGELGWPGHAVAGITMLLGMAALLNTAFIFFGRARGLCVPIVVLLVLSLAALTDLLEGKIWNRLVLQAFGAVSFLLLPAWLGSPEVLARWIGPVDLASSVAGLAAAGSIASLLYLLGALGGGDVKLLGFLGFALGLSGCALAVGHAAVCGVVIGLANAATGGRLFRAAQHALLRMLAAPGACVSGAEGFPFGRWQVPLAFALLVGFVTSR